MKILKNVYIIKCNLYKTQNGVSKPHTKSNAKGLIYALYSNLYKTNKI